MCLVTWPLNESEAGVDLVMIQTSLLFYVNDAVVMLISKNLHKKSSEVSIKTRSTTASLSSPMLVFEERGKPEYPEKTSR